MMTGDTPWACYAFWAPPLAWTRPLASLQHALRARHPPAHGPPLRSSLARCVLQAGLRLLLMLQRKPRPPLLLPCANMALVQLAGRP